jgi:hypothetical protein
MTVELRLPSERAIWSRDYIAMAIRERYTDGRVVATIPTRALEVFAPFLGAPLSEPIDEAVNVTP